MEETFVINLVDDSESDSSDVDIDIAGCAFIKILRKKNRKKKQQKIQQQTNKREEKCIITNINT